MANEMPSFVTDYHLADKRPFLNLFDLAEPELAPVMQDLERRQATAGLKRVFCPRYMHLRRLTEARLHQLCLEAGGMPERRVPHYFVLGSSQWYGGLAPVTREVVLPLADLPTKVISFTYPDSFTSMAFGPPVRPASPTPSVSRARLPPVATQGCGGSVRAASRQHREGLRGLRASTVGEVHRGAGMVRRADRTF